MDQLALHDGTKLSGKWPYSEDTAFVVEKNTAYPVAQIDDHVKHTFREHKQEADHLANVGAEEQRKSPLERETTQNWKDVRGFWDGSTKTDGRSTCGVVIKSVDPDKWITIIEITVTLWTCRSLAAEVAGASVLTGILDLVLGKSLWKT